MLMLVDDIGGLFVTAVQALCSMRAAEGWTLIVGTDHFFVWQKAA